MKKMILLLPVIAGIFWGTTGVFVRQLTNSGLNNLTILFLRVSIASIIYFIILMIRDRKLFKIFPKDIWLLAVYAIFGIIGLNFFYNISITNLTLSLAAVLLALGPIFTMIFASLFVKEKITILKIICMLIALFGCVLVSGMLEDAGTKWSWFGMIIGLLSAVMYGISGTSSKAALNRGHNVLTLLFYGMFIAMICLIPFTDFNAIGSYISQAPLEHILFLIAHSACSSFIPYMLFNICLKRAEAGTSSILAAATEPAAAMILGFIIFLEQPTLLMIGGLVLTIIAITLLLKQDKKG